MDEADATPPPEGLRDRKKRMLRQLISDTATGMFLERGFDEVKVSEIAEACEVSEKTIYNYFPTKESLLFDREEDMAAMIHDALSSRDGRALTEAALAMVENEVDRIYRGWGASFDPSKAVTTIERFSTMIETTPALVAAQHGMMERLTEAAANALAERAGIDPEDPEAQMAAILVVGLWRALFVSMRRHARAGTDVAEIEDAVRDDLRRAARLADSGLESFNLVVQGARTKDQLREAAEATNEARKQVLAAVKQAKDAWRQVMADMHDAQHATQYEMQSKAAKLHPTKADIKAEQYAMKDEIRRRQAEIRRQQFEMRKIANEARRAAHQDRRRPKP
jgi:AcrR family transcriptional regulator